MPVPAFLRQLCRSSAPITVGEVRRHRRRRSGRLRRDAVDVIHVFGALILVVLTPSPGFGRVRGTAILVAAGLTVAGLVGATAALADSGPSAPARTVLTDSLASRQLAADRANRGSRLSPALSTASPSVSTSSPPVSAASPTPTAAAPKPAVTPDWANPMPGVELSSCYGSRWGTVHQGIDFAGDAGTPILAVGAGTVLAAGWNYSGYGISVMIDHGNGLYSHYAHAEKVLVSAGEHVVAGQPIALEGTTGDSTGPHLHFEIHEGLWNQVDPAPWLRAHGVPAAC